MCEGENQLKWKRSLFLLSEMYFYKEINFNSVGSCELKGFRRKAEKEFFIHAVQHFFFCTGKFAEDWMDL